MMLKTIEINPYITRTVRSVADKYKGVLESRIYDPIPSMLKLVKEEPPSTAPKQKEGPRIKYKVVE